MSQVQNIVRRTIAESSQKLDSHQRLRIGLSLASAAKKYNLDLDKMEGFDTFNLLHDVFGIANHWDGAELTDCFWPRCGAKKATATHD